VLFFKKEGSDMYTVLLHTSGATRRNVEEWIRNWNDSAGGTWGQPDEAGPDAWSITLEIGDVEKARTAIDYTNTNDSTLTNFAISAA
jgi:hypothetical protein